MKKRDKILAQIIILGLVFWGLFLLFNYIDNKERKELYYASNTNIVKEENHTKTITLSLSQNVGAPRYEYLITGYVYLPNETLRETVQSMEIPWGETDCYLYMDFRAITDTSSKQWALQQTAWTDSQGLRRIGDDYCVALGTFYGQVGDRFRITTDKGNVYSVTMADAKGYDSNGWYHVAGNGNINLVEFIVQTEYLPSEVTVMGDCGVLDNIGGNVIKIEKLV